MRKGKLLIITTTALMLLLSGFLVYQLLFQPLGSSNDKDTGTASAMAISSGKNSQEISEGNFGNNTYNPDPMEYDNNNGNEDGADMLNNSTSWSPVTEMDLDPESITVFVNKEFALPQNYVPKNMVIPNVLFDIKGYDPRKLLQSEAAIALEQLFAAASKDGHTLYGISGYRSYDRQKQIFTSNIITKGKKHTLQYSAVPGTSEHQTGLSIDVSSKSLRYRLITTFASSSEGKWLADNAHSYGYIIRYPKGKEDVTGYAYEPWHIRYVGTDLARYLHSNNLTLDEYYNYRPSDGFDFEALYADLINYRPPITPDDLDGDGVPNHLDNDIDGDGIPNAIDDDIDGDGIPNEEDEDMDGDGVPNSLDDDMDGDGIPNNEDNDMDGDGIPNHLDDDMDGDGIPNSEDDDMDGDGIPNHLDDDVDGDGIHNDDDDDIDGDGILNWEDDDIDGDGIPNHLDDDMDGDGIPNKNDPDMNANGILDFKESAISTEPDTGNEETNPSEVTDPEEEIGSGEDIDPGEYINPDEEFEQEGAPASHEDDFANPKGKNLLSPAPTESTRTENVSNSEPVDSKNSDAGGTPLISDTDAIENYGYPAPTAPIFEPES